MKNNLWILTEERPKKDVLNQILLKFIKDNKFAAILNELKILPILENGKFTFTYQVEGFLCKRIENIFIKTISGESSMVDFLIFFQLDEPTQKDSPIYAIEETKTDDKESRNTGIYQRASKFIYVKQFYPNAKLIMLYNLSVTQKVKPTNTYIFGTKMLKQFGVEILGKTGIDDNIFAPFSSIKDFIEIKNSMPATRNGQSVRLKKYKDRIEITAILSKGGRLSHDPNIGMTTMMAQTLRSLGWEKNIVITMHRLPSQQSVGNSNKFIRIANMLNISLENLSIPVFSKSEIYWRYDNEGEKLGTIFIHIIVEEFTQGYSIFENHAGCEKGYFVTSEGESISLAKYKDRAKYKAGDGNQIIHIPDLILFDFPRNQVINVEGKKYQFRQNGISELNNYDFIEKEYIRKFYKDCEIIRTVVLYGSQEEEIIEIEVGFLLNENGQLILGVKAPLIFHDAVKHLLDFWKE